MATGRLSPKEKQDSLQTVTGVIAGVSAAGVLAGTAISMLQEMQKNSSPAWIAQIDLLEKFRNKISDELLYMGIPSDKLETKDEKAIQNAVQKYGKAYFMLENYDNKATALSGGYVISLMPKDENLIAVTLDLNGILEPWKKHIAFVAFRPTPGITKSAWNSKTLSRIIIKLNVEDRGKEVAKIIIDTLKEKYPNPNTTGLNVQPRYSKKVNELIWVSYGSEDFKDSPTGKARYTPNKYKNSKLSRWLPWFFGPSDAEMAFEIPDEQDPTLEPLT
jgi:hypothetical protein